MRAARSSHTCMLAMARVRVNGQNSGHSWPVVQTIAFRSGNSDDSESPTSPRCRTWKKSSRSRWPRTFQWIQQHHLQIFEEIVELAQVIPQERLAQTVDIPCATDHSENRGRSTARAQTRTNQGRDWEYPCAAPHREKRGNNQASRGGHREGDGAIYGPPSATDHGGHREMPQIIEEIDEGVQSTPQKRKKKHRQHKQTVDMVDVHGAASDPEFRGLMSRLRGSVSWLP